MKKGLLNFSSDVSGSIKDSEIIFIAVGTPQNFDGSANVEFVESVAETLQITLTIIK